MDLRASWTFGGDLVIGDYEEEGTPVITVKFHEKELRTSVIDEARYHIAYMIHRAIVETEHPFHTTPSDEEAG